MVSVENIVDRLINKYKKYSISSDVIFEYVKKESVNFDNDRKCENRVSMLLDSLIISQITENGSKSNIKVIAENYSYIKESVIKKNKNIFSHIVDIANKNGLNIDSTIDDLYNKAIDKIVTKKFNYDYDKLLSENILKSVNQIILQNMDTKKNNINVDESKLYDISFLMAYFKVYNIPLSKLEKYSGIPVYELYQYIYLKKLIPGYRLSKILEYFNVISYEELINYAKSDKKIYSYLSKKWRKLDYEIMNVLQKEKKHDISFLRDYLKNNNISHQLLADALSIKLSTLNGYLYGKSLAPESIVDKLVKLFNVKDYDELKEKVTKNELEVPQILLKKYDISFLKDYLKNNNISQQLLADALSIKLRTLNNYLSGRNLVSKSIVDRLVKLFNVKDYDELKEKVINNELVIPQILLLNRKRKETDSNIVIEGKSLAQSCKLNTSKNNKYNISNAQQMVNIECLLDLIDISTISKLDYFIMMLLFGGIEGKYYNVVAISNFFQIDNKYVYDIYKKCLKLYEASLNKIIDDIYILNLINK